jgi:uncharacterized integral membrane protein
MRKLLTLLDSLIVAIIIAVLAVFGGQNTHSASYQFLGAQFTAPVWWISTAAAILGLVVGLLVLAPGFATTGWRAHGLRRDHTRLRGDYEGLQGQMARLNAEHEALLAQHQAAVADHNVQPTPSTTVPPVVAVPPVGQTPPVLAYQHPSVPSLDNTAVGSPGARPTDQTDGVPSLDNTALGSSSQQPAGDPLYQEPQTEPPAGQSQPVREESPASWRR